MPMRDRRQKDLRVSNFALLLVEFYGTYCRLSLRIVAGDDTCRYNFVSAGRRRERKRTKKRTRK